MVLLDVDVFVCRLIQGMERVEIDMGVRGRVLVEKVPTSEDPGSCGRGVCVEQLMQGGAVGNIPMSSTRDSGIVPFLTYAVRFPPK